MSALEENSPPLIIKSVTPCGIIIYTEGEEEKYYTPYVATNERYLSLPIGKKIKEHTINETMALYITRTPDGVKPRIEKIGVTTKAPS